MKKTLRRYAGIWVALSILVAAGLLIGLTVDPGALNMAAGAAAAMIIFFGVFYTVDKQFKD
jgi:hypothetical protein